VILGREVIAVLGQHVPDGMDLDDVVRDLEGVPGVVEVHDLHVWTLTSGMHVATAHLVVSVPADSQGVLDQAREVMRTNHNLEHATLQVEDRPSQECEESTW
jgi:cobalt-zinc-cadmium efflux system protein